MDDKEIPPVVLIPKNLNIHKLFPEWKKSKKDWAALLIDLILYRQHMMYDDKDDGWQQIHSDVIGKFVSPKSKKEICDSLKYAGVIETTTYQADKYSMKYRLSKKYYGRISEWTITAKNPLKKLMEARQQELKRRYSKIPDGIGRLLFNDLFRLSFDESLSCKAIESFVTKKKRMKADLRFQLLCMKRLRGSVDDYGRFHSSVTTLNKPLRRILLADNEPLVELDISNSQPLILSAHLGTSTDDLKEFREVTEKGRLYDQILDDFDWPKEKRDFVKKSVNKTFQGDDSPKYRKEVGVFLREKFPSVMETLDKIKLKDWSISELLDRQFDLVNKKVRDVPEPYKLASHQLQKWESEIVVDKIAVQFKELFPLAFLSTIHDGFMIHPNREKEMREIIEKVFGDELGVKPTVKTK